MSPMMQTDIIIGVAGTILSVTLGVIILWIIHAGGH